MFTLHNKDVREIIESLKHGDIDVVFTDPPYGIEGSSGKINLARGKGNYSSEFEDTPEYIEKVIVPIVKKLISVCGCVVLTPGNKNFSLYPQPDSFGCFYQPAAVGLQVFGNLDAQPIFYYGKNASKKNMGVPCSYQLTEQAEKNGHPCVKPIKAWNKILSNISLAGQTIFDPFMGSGTTGVAALQLDRNFIGCEISPEYYSIAEKRIQSAALQPSLFTPSNNRVHWTGGESPANPSLFPAEVQPPAKVTRKSPRQ